MVKKALIALCLCLLPVCGWSFGGDGCGSGKCSDCHSLTKKEVVKLLPPGVDSIDSVRFSEIRGLWEVNGTAAGRKFVVYIDFSKKYLIAGEVLRLRDGQNVSRRIDPATISTDGAFLVGSAAAPVKIYVFSDIHCPHCKKLHKAMHEVVKKEPRVAFYVKLMSMFTPLKTVQNIICSKSLAVLDKAYDGKKIGIWTCDSKAAAATMDFARKNRIHSAPQMVFPDGRIVTGERTSAKLLKELEPYLPKK